MDARKVFKYNRAPAGPGPRAPGSSQENLNSYLLTKRARESAEVLHRGRYESFWITDQFKVDTASADPFDIVSYTVPPARALTVNKVGVIIADPLLQSGNWFYWRLAVNGEKVPAVGANSDWITGFYGDLYNPLEIIPIVVQAGETVSIQGRDHYGNILEGIYLIGALVGKLHQLQGPGV